MNKTMNIIKNILGIMFIILCILLIISSLFSIFFKVFNTLFPCEINDGLGLYCTNLENKGNLIYNIGVLFNHSNFSNFFNYISPLKYFIFLFVVLFGKYFTSINYGVKLYKKTIMIFFISVCLDIIMFLYEAVLLIK